MNNKITLNKLIKLLSEKTGKDENICVNLLKGLFQQVSDSLERGESIKVKGLGTFKLSRVESRKSVDVTSGKSNEIPAHSRIVFLPSKELAAAVNAPFEMFETLELDENILEEELASVENDPEQQLLANEYETQLIEEHEKESELIEKYPDLPEIIKESQPEVAHEEEKGAKSDNEDKRESRSEADKEKKTMDMKPVIIPESSHKHKRKRSFQHGFLWGIIAALLILIIGVGLLCWLNEDFSKATKNMFSGNEQKTVQQKDTVEVVNSGDSLLNDRESEIGLEENDMAEIEAGVPDMVEDVPADKVVPTQPSDPKPVYDTVTTTHYLTSMAKKYYGNYHLWPYIYKENEKILGHPNRIRPGTKVVIPDLSKYGVDPKNPKDIEKAKNMGAEIYKKYD